MRANIKHESNMAAWLPLRPCQQLARVILYLSRRLAASPLHAPLITQHH